MQNGPYVTERALPQIIRDICVQRSIDYESFSDDWVLRLQSAGTVRWIVGHKFDVNTSAVGHLAQDKVATYMTLAAAGVPTVEHYLVRSLPHDPNEWHYTGDNSLEGRPVVVKPLDGTGGRAVERYESVADAMAAIHRSGEPAWAIAPHYDLQAEYRLVMLDGQLLLSLEKTQPTFRGTLKLFNLGYGAVARDIADDVLLEELQTMAVLVMQKMALRLASVDIVRMPDGSLRVLEVNDGITLEHYIRQSSEYKNRAAQVYDAIVAAQFV